MYWGRIPFTFDDGLSYVTNMLPMSALVLWVVISETCISTVIAYGSSQVKSIAAARAKAHAKKLN
jgi:hypothetical protein